MDRMKEIFNRKDLVIDMFNTEDISCENCNHLRDEMMLKVNLHEKVFDELQKVTKEVVSKYRLCLLYYKVYV